MFQNKPVILITSGEHYGVLLNLDFDYVAYLNALQKEGMNNTRVFSGAYVERKNDIDWLQYNSTLSPKPNRLITPWKRGSVPGYANGGNKFDLDQWNEQYFLRVKDLLRQAAQRSILVEFTLFGNQYGDGIYSYSPLYPDNNIQGVGIKRKDGFLDFQSLKDSALVARQDAMVTKIIKELNKFDNLYYEISNEPYNEVKDSSLVDQWHVHMANLIRETEKSLSKKHLIASNQAIVDNPQVDIANYHYVHIPNSPDFDSLLHLNKVISMDETMGALRNADVSDVRVEAWDFILHGGGAYNNLNWEYIPSNPQGNPAADTIREYLQYLQKFISGFNFVKMTYSPNLLKKVPEKAITRLLAEPGSQYALYIHHSKPYDPTPNTEGIWKYKADTSIFNDTVTVHVERGIYTARWYNPITGKWIGEGIKWQQKTNNYNLYTGPYMTDIALSIVRE
ncbi:MAG: hypothetical protein M3R50_09665 [Bacteroidota bacterium]|nr:hypothetical protein [Bacteroidota bacterium]